MKHEKRNKVRKLLFIVGLMAFLLPSCSKQTDTEESTISVGFRYVESGSMCSTRADIVPNIGEALDAIMPVALPLTLTGETSVFNCLSGEGVTLPYGHYSVSGASLQAKTYIGQSAYASKTPLVIVEDAIDVSYGVRNYSVNATIGSFVLAWSRAAVQSVTIAETNDTLPCVTCGETSVCCITGDMAEEPLAIMLNPREGQPWAMRSFTITTSANGDGIHCENGKWYALSPTYVPSESGLIDIQCETWSEGGNYY